MSTVTLVSSDGNKFMVERKVLKLSTTISDLLADCEEITTLDVIPITNIKGNVLQKVLDYCEHHVNDEQLNTENLYKDIDPWDAEFYNVELKFLFDIIMASNYLSIKSLLDVGCKIIANMIKGKTVEQIRETFNIPIDFSPNEEQEIKL